eukprot:2913989-Amphidinium_carterae.1
MQRAECLCGGLAGRPQWKQGSEDQPTVTTSCHVRSFCVTCVRTHFTCRNTRPDLSSNYMTALMRGRWRLSGACCAYRSTSPCSGTGTSQVVAWPRRP